MRVDQMRFYDRICKFKIAAFVLLICTSVNKKIVVFFKNNIIEEMMMHLNFFIIKFIILCTCSLRIKL